MTAPQPTSPQRPQAQTLFTEEEAKLRAELYIQQRIDYQDDYYERRMAEYRFNSDIMLWITAGLMGVSTVISSYSVVADQPVFAFLTTLLPAFAAAVAAFRSLYQWQRQAQIYEGTWLGLQRARLAMPDEDFLDEGDFARYFPELVQQTEAVLRREASQWGQLKELQSPVEQYNAIVEQSQNGSQITGPGYE
jgi:hypothetical protein